MFPFYLPKFITFCKKEIKSSQLINIMDKFRFLNSNSNNFKIKLYTSSDKSAEIFCSNKKIQKVNRLMMELTKLVIKIEFTHTRKFLLFHKNLTGKNFVQILGLDKTFRQTKATQIFLGSEIFVRHEQYRQIKNKSDNFFPMRYIIYFFEKCRKKI